MSHHFPLPVRYLLATFFFLSSAQAADQTSEASEYGDTLVKEFQLSAEQINKFSNFIPSKPDPHDIAVVNVLNADTEDWMGPAFLPETTKNPYTLVLTLEGTARTDGNIHTMWQSGWKKGDDGTKLFPFPGPWKQGVKAGEHVRITKAANSVSFKENKEVAPVLALVRADNFEFESAKVQIWSGFPKTSSVDLFFSFPGMFVGLAFFALVWWFRSR